MPSTGAHYVHYKSEEIYSALPGASSVTIDVTVPANMRRLSLIAKNNGLDVNITSFSAWDYTYPVMDFNNDGRLTSRSTTVASPNLFVITPAGNHASTAFGGAFKYLTPGMALRFYFGLSGAPSTGTLDVTAHWTS